MSTATGLLSALSTAWRDEAPALLLCIAAALCAQWLSWRAGHRGFAAHAVCVLRAGACVVLLLLGVRELREVRTERNTERWVLAESPSRAADAARAGSADARWLAQDGAAVSLSDSVQVAMLLPQRDRMQSVVALDGTEPLRGGARITALHALLWPVVRRAAAPIEALNIEIGAEAQPGVPLPSSLRLRLTRAGTVSIASFVDGQRSAEQSVTLEAGEHVVPLAPFTFSSGRHGVLVLADMQGASRAASASVDCTERAEVLVVCAEQEPQSVRLLRAQGRRVLCQHPDETGNSIWLRTARCVVFDRVPAARLAQADVLAPLRQRAARGLGWIHVPPAVHGDLRTAAGEPFAALLPAREVPQSPPPPPEQPPPPKPDESQPADPSQSTREVRSVPTFGLIVAIDSSGSMEGEPIRLAREAAWAAVQVLHPEDLAGVIAFNKEARELLALTKAGDKDVVRDRISRIRCGGGTDFSPALELAEEMFAGEKLSIRHLIMLSDGESEPGRFEALAQRMARNGITISTVGCGAGLNVRDLSNIAAQGRGKFYPAYSLQEVPEILTIEAERVIAASGARHAPAEPPAPSAQADPPKSEPPVKPEPHAADPLRHAVRQVAQAALLQGIPVAELPPVEDLLALEVTAEGTAVLAAEDRALLVLGQCGAARVAQFAAPFEGAWMPRWSGDARTQLLLAQVSAWCEGTAPSMRAQLEAEDCGGVIAWTGDDLFSRHAGPGLQFRATVPPGSPSGTSGVTIMGSPAPATWLTAAAHPAVLGTLTLADGSVAASAQALSPRWDLECALPHLPGIDAWAAALDAPLVRGIPEAGVSVERSLRRIQPESLLALAVCALLLTAWVLERCARRTLLLESES